MEGGSDSPFLRGSGNWISQTQTRFEILARYAPPPPSPLTVFYLNLKLRMCGVRFECAAYRSSQPHPPGSDEGAKLASAHAAVAERKI